jgi:hypothetical protein
MPSNKRIPPPFASFFDTESSACEHGCPHCKSSVFRVSRRFSDLFLSLFITLRRYRCISMKCNWEGNLREKRNFLPGYVPRDLKLK